MKKILLLSLFSLPLFADYDLEDVAAWEMEQSLAPYHLEVSADWIGDSKFTQDSVKGDHLRYSTWEAEWEMVAYNHPCCGEGANLAFSFDQAHLDWECNPFFDRRNFNTAALSLLVYSQRLPNWNWIGQTTYRIDSSNWGFIDYSSYDWFLWGRWNCSDQIGLHAGIFGQTGLRFPLILPILGLDWTFCENWKLSLVFPVNLSLRYLLDDCWSISLQGRWWCDRHRVGKHEHLSKALWRYINYGLEVATTYDANSWLSLDLHGGCAFGGNVKVMHRRDHFTHTLHFKPAAYIGGELTAQF